MKTCYIIGASAVSHQASFRNPGYSTDIQPFETGSVIIAPDYKEFVPAMSLRRMSTIIRMGIAAGMDSLLQAGIDQPGAIITGTGLGCLAETEKFLDNYLTIKDSLIPPTSFIQSTHNTIAGQLSLMLKNHNYNMTHTQDHLSFEHALQDAMLSIQEGKNNILVGAADEHIGLLDELAEKLHLTGLQGKMSNGSAFFVLSNEASGNEKMAVRLCRTVHGVENGKAETERILREAGRSMEDFDVVIGCGTQANEIGNIHIQAEDLFGYSYAASSLALHLANDILMQKDSGAKSILLLNFEHKALGITILENLEA